MSRASERELDHATGVYRDPGVWGGHVWLAARSRVPVFIIAQYGEEARRAYSHLDDGRLDGAFRFAREHPDKIRADRDYYDEANAEIMRRFPPSGTR